MANGSLTDHLHCMLMIPKFSCYIVDLTSESLIFYLRTLS
ncbi:unnamed protein product [Brassica oleracea var. botrytis]